jgi:hypothetical protein
LKYNKKNLDPALVKAQRQEKDLLREKVEAHQKREPDHKPLMSRRDFLGAGLVQGAGMMFLPSALTLIGREAQAQSSGVISSPPAYIEIDAAGGAAFMRSLVMTDASRYLLPSYNLCSQGRLSIAQSNMTTLFSNNAPMFKNSGLYKGITSTIGAQTDVFSNSVLFGIPSNLSPDTQGNLMSALGLVQSSIASGAYYPCLQSTSPINQPAYLSPPTPLVVAGIDSLRDTVRARPTDLISSFSRATQASLTKFARALSTSQLSLNSARPGASQLTSAYGAAMDKVQALLGPGAVSFDPRNDAGFISIWSSVMNDGNPDIYGPANVESGIVYNLLKGYATSAAVQRAGYDYHNRSFADVDAADTLIGQLIGRMLLSAKYLNKPLMIYVCTDGSCNGPAVDDPSTVTDAFVTDGVVNAVNFFIAYRPGGVGVTPNPGDASKPDFQIGQFTTGQVSDLKHPAASDRGCAAAVWMNYLALAGVNGVTVQNATTTLTTTDALAQMVRIKTA